MGGVPIPPQSFPGSITNCAEEAAAGIREKETDTETWWGGEKRDATLSPFPSFLNTAQSSGSGEQSERCGTYPYSKSPDGADLNQPPTPQPSPCYKYSGKPADTGNNKQRHMLRSTSVGRRHSSCLRASHFSSEFIHEGAPFGARHNTGKPELAGGRARQPRGPVWALVLLWRNKLSPSENIMLGDKTLHSPLWSSNQSVLHETRHL